jgi:hypothetical protein
MNAIKKIAFCAMLAIGGFSAVTMTSCKGDDKTCEAGYEGSDCKTESRTKFINASGWAAIETGSTSGSSAYAADILTSSTGVQTILIKNLWGTFNNVTVATVSGNSFTISRQSPDSDGFYVTGSGTINTSTGVITVNYTVTDETGSTVLTDVVSGNWTKL